MKTTANKIKQEYDNYLALGLTGHFPLFFDDWVKESHESNQKLNLRKANHNVAHVFNQLAKHTSLEKKKTALIGMDRLSREEFIRSFFKVVEHKHLSEVKTLQ